MYLLPFFLLHSLALALSSPPSGAVIVSKTPKSGQYGTVQAAISSLSTTSTTPQVVFIYNGTYSEQVTIPSRKATLKIYGQASTSAYSSNTVTITHSLSASAAGSDDASGTVRNQASSTSFYNLNIANTYGSGSQAIALSAYSSKQGYYACQITGYQDTLLAQTGTQFYGSNLIQGRTDFIFGQHAQAWIQGGDIKVLAGGGSITASGRNSSSDVSSYVLDSVTVSAASGQNVAAGVYYLGRPWGDYARVMWQNSTLGNVINAAGWSVWQSSSPHTDHVSFQEYGNTGAGASGTRASFSSKASAAIGIASVLGSDYANWVDAAYL